MQPANRNEFSKRILKGDSVMFRKISATLGALLLVLATSVVVSAATLSSTLQTRLAGAADSLSVGTVIVTFNTTNGLNESHLSVLRGLGKIGRASCRERVEVSGRGG